MKTTKLSIVLLLALLCTSAFARKAKDPCESVEVEKSAFGVTRSVEVGKWNALSGGIYQGVGIIENSDGIRGSFVFFQFGSVQTSIPAGTEVAIALMDGTLLKLTSTVETPANPHVNQQGVWTEWHIELPIDKSFLEAVAKSSISATQVKIAGKTVEVELSKGDSKDIQNAAKCFTGVVVAEK